MKYFKSAEDAMIDYMEPKVPCENFETRPCVRVNNKGTKTLYKKQQCKKICFRFPNRPLDRAP